MELVISSPRVNFYENCRPRSGHSVAAAPLAPPVSLTPKHQELRGLHPQSSPASLLTAHFQSHVPMSVSTLDFPPDISICLSSRRLKVSKLKARPESSLPLNLLLPRSSQAQEMEPVSNRCSGPSNSPRSRLLFPLIPHIRWSAHPTGSTSTVDPEHHHLSSTSLAPKPRPRPTIPAGASLPGSLPLPLSLCVLFSTQQSFSFPTALTLRKSQCPHDGLRLSMDCSASPPCYPSLPAATPASVLFLSHASHAPPSGGRLRLQGSPGIPHGCSPATFRSTLKRPLLSEAFPK